MKTLKITDLTVTANDKEILRNFNLEINPGEIHMIMGPNGAGKSTLIKVIMGDANYEITQGQIIYDGIPITNMSVSERAKMGIFMSFQRPYEIEGVTNVEFLRSACQIKEGNDFKLDSFLNTLEKEITNLKMDKEMIHHDINSNFSNGERKKNEILQMLMLKPSLIMLDEIDAGLDDDSLKVVSKMVNDYYKKNKPALLLITSDQKLFDYIKPDFGHIMINGQIVKSGDSSLINDVEKDGDQKFIKTSTSVVKENK